MKSDVFKKELGYIKNEKYKESVAKLLGMLPDYFFEVPASSTGKYHPPFSLGDGGLVRHTKAAVRLAYDMLKNKCIGHSFNDDEKDLMIVALLIHDGLKLGREKSKYTVFEHPIIMADFILENKNELSFNDEEIKLLTDVIRSHMGQWNTSEYSNTILPLPSNKYERFVHMCDDLSSKRYLDIKFDNNDIID